MRDVTANWQTILSQGFKTADALLDFLELPKHLSATDAHIQFATRVPRGFAARMQKGNPLDPLLLQVLAQAKELENPADFVKDPLDEAAHNPHPGLIHKYHGRVLLTLTGVCAINCRYCFRRHFPYAENNPGRAGWQVALDYIAADVSIHEVILSGGDPLLARDQTLREIIQALEDIPHVTTLRIHSRVPVVLPERVDDAFGGVFEATRLKRVMVLHVNHAQELSEAVAACSRRLTQIGFLVLNQTVLLAGINDSVAVLEALSQRLFSCGILPYYLHALDKVAGAHHFALDDSKAVALYQDLLTRLPGYLVPRLVREVPGALSKVPIHV